MKVGPSTGWLYAKGVYSPSRQEAILTKVGANSVEVCLNNWSASDRRLASLKEGPAFGSEFLYRSLHLPPLINENLEDQIATTRDIIVRCGAAAAVVHPLKMAGEYPIKHYESMVAAGIPVAIENMDSRNDSGFDLAELKKLVSIEGCGFVLDVQHAYERDPEMIYAAELLDALKEKLMHLHVSGETSDNVHALVCKAGNVEKIVAFVRKVLAVKKIPLILEGEYATSAELQEEIEFLTKELS